MSAHEFFGNTLTEYLLAIAAFLALLWVLLLAKKSIVSRLRALRAAAGVDSLPARLLEMKHEEQERQLAELRGEYTKAEWGSQIRSYTLQPYRMIKDHRTKHEEGNVDAVLDGDLDRFVEAYLLNPGEE